MLNDTVTKNLVVSDSGSFNPNQRSERVVLLNEKGEKISNKTDAEVLV